MAEFLASVSAYSWPTLFGVVVAFGFLPGFTLRVILLCYPSEDPRRQEIMADLYGRPRAERPFFVAEQLETVLFDALPLRISKAKKDNKTRKEDSKAEESTVDQPRRDDSLRGLRIIPAPPGAGKGFVPDLIFQSKEGKVVVVEVKKFHHGPPSW